MFLEDSSSPEKDLEIVYSSGPEKDRLEAWQVFYCSCCLASSDCGGGEDGLEAANVLAVRQWWLEERQLMLACRHVKTPTVCQTVGTLKTEMTNK